MICINNYNPKFKSVYIFEIEIVDTIVYGILYIYNDFVKY